MSVRPMPRYTPAEYLAIERAAETKSEFYGGEMFAMSGASRAHNLIAGNFHTELNLSLRDRPCEAYINDMRVQVQASGLYTYPDVAVACDEPIFEDSQLDTLLNPVLLVEVLSDSTERYDRGRKFQMYRELPSLQEYVLVTQDRPYVEVFTRHESGFWTLTEAMGMDATIRLASINCNLPLARIYAKVRFSETE